MRSELSCTGPSQGRGLFRDWWVMGPLQEGKVGEHEGTQSRLLEGTMRSSQAFLRK